MSDRDKVKIMQADGTLISLDAWKVKHKQPTDDSIGRYFTLREKRFRDDIAAYGELIVNEQLMKVLDAYRQAIGHPVSINSFNRSEAKQAELKKQGFKAASKSPHVVKLAADVDTPGLNEIIHTRGYNAVAMTPELQKEARLEMMRVNYDSAITMRQCARALNIKVRIGHKQYLQLGQTFIHVDVCPEYYAPGRPFHKHSHPLAWEEEITW